MGTTGIYAPLKYYGRVEIIQTPLYQYLIADFESQDIKEQEMPEPEPADGDEPHFMLLALVVPKAM